MINYAGLKQRKPTERTHINFNRELKHPIKYYENLQKILDARSTKKANIQLRKNILDHNRKINYQNEFERIRGELYSQLIRGINNISLKGRIKELERLGAKAIESIQ